MEYTNRIIKHNYKYRPQISFICLVLCAIFGLVLGFLAKLPSPMTQLFRPVFIFLCLLTLKYSKYYKFGSVKIHIASLIYYTFILFYFNVTKATLTLYTSIALFILFFVFAGNRVWSKKEIRLILITVTVACAIQAVITIYSNPGILNNTGNAHIDFLGTSINRNSIAFAVVPGTICGMFLLLYDKYKMNILRALLYLFCCLVCLFVLFALACRSAFFAGVVGLVCVIWQRARDSYDKVERFIRKAIAVALIVTALLSAMFLSKGTLSSRLFEFGDDDTGSGRDTLWAEAWMLIDENPVFGGGYTYWEDTGHSMGTHNAFLTYMVMSGWTGGILLGSFLLMALIEALKTKNLIPLSFAAEVITHSWTEPGMDYYAYIPLILMFIIMKYLNYRNKNLSTIFI